LGLLCQAAKDGDTDFFSKWKLFVNDALDQLVMRLNNDVEDILGNVEGIKPLLAKTRNDYHLYSLSIADTEREDSEGDCGLVFEGYDFMQHIYTGLDKVDDKALQTKYKLLLDDMLRFGGLWQTQLPSMEWTIKSDEELCAVKDWICCLGRYETQSLEVLIDGAKTDPLLEPFITCILDSMEYEFGGIDLNSDEVNDWIQENSEGFFSLGSSQYFVEQIAKAPCPDSPVPNSLINRQLDGMKQASEDHYGNNPESEDDWLPSFALREENIQYLSFVLAPFESNEPLDVQSQADYEHFQNTDEAKEIYDINLQSSNWYQDLLSMVLAMTIMLVAIEAMLDSLPKEATM
jgi:hypothetical protein